MRDGSQEVRDGGQPGSRRPAGRVTRALAALFSCGTAGLAGLIVGLVTEDSAVEVCTPAALTGFAALLAGGPGLVRGLRR